MLISNKTRKVLFSIGLMLVLCPTTAQACNPLNPICLFKMMLKATPGLPVMDFVSIPPIIPHVPAALLKEAQAKVKEIADNALKSIRSGSLPSLADIKIEPPDFSGASGAAGQDPTSLEAFPSMDIEDPKNIAESVEVIFLKPGSKDKDSKMSIYDKQLMNYYHDRFRMDNLIEITAYSAYMNSKVEELVAFAEDIQKEVDSADDLNKAQRANYGANLMEYQLSVMLNQLEAARLQLNTSIQMTNGKYVLEESLLGN